MSTLAINLSDELADDVRRLSTQYQMSETEFVVDCLRKRVASDQFESLCKATQPYAIKAGFLTDEDVFKAIS